MRKGYLLLAVLLLCSGCHAHRSLATNDNDRQPTRSKSNNTNRYTVGSYIEAFKAIAIDNMETYGIPASITLAQAINESANGNSNLARNANNHFGVKCTSSWKGEKYYKNGDRSNDCYRFYRNAEDSFTDHAEFLKRDRYAVLFDMSSTDYKGWAHGLKRTGYASNPKYPHLLIGLIEKYNLHQYDRKIKRKNRRN